MAETVRDFNAGALNDIFDSLDDLGYEGPLLNPEVFQKAVEEGLQSVDFASLVQWITTQLNSYAGLDEHIQTTDLEDTDNFLMELSGFLREYGCPYKSLTEGLLQQRFVSKESRLLLLDYLLTELQAAKIISHKRPKLAKSRSSRDDLQTHPYEQIQDLMISFGISEDQDDFSNSSLFAKLSEKISHCLSTIPSGYASKPMLSSLPSEEDWSKIEYISQSLKQDYNCRRQMIIQRLDVTMQSFSWSEKIENNKDQLSCLYHSARAKMTPNSEISLAHLLAAREDVLQIEKTCGDSARERTKCGINQVMIGAVPDRGGRPYEMDRPPPEMPAFQQRRPQKGNQDNRRPYQQQSDNWQNAKRRR